MLNFLNHPTVLQEFLSLLDSYFDLVLYITDGYSTQFTYSVFRLFLEYIVMKLSVSSSHMSNPLLQ
jgi:hypothetical protein